MLKTIKKLIAAVDCYSIKGFNPGIVLCLSQVKS
jgi:hypothetical protein